MCPLRGDVLTLAEFLGSLGYATAGFVGNTAYCSYDSGLDRGFTHFQDYVVNKLSAIRTVHLIDSRSRALARLGPSLADALDDIARCSRTVTENSHRTSIASFLTGYRGVVSPAAPSSPL